MTDDLPLFNAPPEPAGPYQVPSLRAHGHEFRGDWLVLWAEARHVLHSHQDRAAVMKLEGFDPDAWMLYPTAPINILDGGFKRSWWMAWERGKPTNNAAGKA